MTSPQPPLTEADIGNVLLTLLTYIGSDARLLERVICQLRRERDEAREALKPFADAADSLGEDHDDGADIWESPAAMCVTAGDLRRARKATTT
jgi:hypothetical protein